MNGVPTVFPAEGGHVSPEENMLKIVYDHGPVQVHTNYYHIHATWSACFMDSSNPICLFVQDFEGVIWSLCWFLLHALVGLHAENLENVLTAATASG